MKVVISGYYGSGNAGDEAMLTSILKLFAKSLPQVNITVLSVNPNDTIARHKVKAVAHLNPFAVIKSIFDSDLLISGGGSLLQNVTSRRSLYYYLGVILIAIIFQKKVMLFAQGIGPIYGNFPRQLTKFILNKVDLITVRDSGSLDELQRLNIFKPQIECTADPVLALNPVELDFGKNIIDKVNRPLIGIAIRRWKNFERFKFELAKAIDSIDADFIFIPMQVPFDVFAADEVKQLTKKNCKVLEDKFSTNELLSIVGNLDLLIAVRLHALIFASVMNVPMLGISYDPKIDRFLNSIGQSSIGEINQLDTFKISKAIKNKLNKKGDETCTTELFQKLKLLAERNIILATDLLQRLQ